MPRKILSIVESGYRGTLEEQDDTIVWLTHALKGAGASLTLLLRGNAVNYAVKGQDASGLAFGDKRQARSTRIAEDLAALAGKGVEVLAVEGDLAERGIADAALIPGVKKLAAAGLPALLAAHDQVWHW